MRATRPQVEPSGWYTQSQAARALEIDRHTVARYAAEGLIRFRVRKAGKRAVTAGSQIIKVWETMYL